jgi:hypothetical protein
VLHPGLVDDVIDERLDDGGKTGVEVVSVHGGSNWSEMVGVAVK